MEARSREGVVKRFPLLTVSAAALMLEEHYQECSVDDITSLIARLKKKAKRREDRMIIAHLNIPCHMMLARELKKPAV